MGRVLSELCLKCQPFIAHLFLSTSKGKCTFLKKLPYFAGRGQRMRELLETVFPDSFFIIKVI